MRHDSGAHGRPTRRECLRSILAVPTTLASASAAPIASKPKPKPKPKLAAIQHMGRLSPPIPCPDIALQFSSGTRQRLKRVLDGHTTALQLIFTGCTTVCPIQGVVFRRVQELLPRQIDQAIQLLSVSINPLEDTAHQLKAWLDRHLPQPGWLAARPEPSAVEAIFGIFGEDGPAYENHATEVAIFNRRAELVWRTYQLPSAESLAHLLAQPWP